MDFCGANRGNDAIHHLILLIFLLININFFNFILDFFHF